MPSIGVGIAGVGSWGVNYVRVLASQPGWKVRWLCDPNERVRARASTLAPEARETASFEEMLADEQLTAIVISTPARTHADLACQALAAGKHVLVEKPLALTTADAARVVEAARVSDRTALVGHLLHYHPALNQLAELVRSGELGTLRYLHSTRVNLGRLRSDENALWSFGPHDLSMLELVIGQQPVSVAAHGGAYLQPGIEDVVFMTLRYPDGVMGHVHLSWLDPRKERRLTIVGSRKMAEFDDVAADKLRIFDRGYDRPPEFTQYGEYLTIRHGDVHIPKITMEEPLQIMVRHFRDCCRDKVAALTDVHSGARIVAVLTAAQQSLGMGGLTVPILQS